MFLSLSICLSVSRDKCHYEGIDSQISYVSKISFSSSCSTKAILTEIKKSADM